jgi:hypothetical protein
VRHIQRTAEISRAMIDSVLEGRCIFDDPELKLNPVSLIKSTMEVANSLRDNRVSSLKTGVASVPAVLLVHGWLAPAAGPRSATPVQLPSPQQPAIRLRHLGRCSPNTHRLVAEEGGFIYNADSYADDLPYWDSAHTKPQLMVPYTLDANDMRFATMQGFNSGDQFFAYLKDTFDVLYREGGDLPWMMSVGLHCRLAGRPGRTVRSSAFSTTRAPTTGSGSPGASTLPGMGSLRTRSWNESRFGRRSAMRP